MFTKKAKTRRETTPVGFLFWVGLCCLLLLLTTVQPLADSLINEAGTYALHNGNKKTNQ